MADQFLKQVPNVVTPTTSPGLLDLLMLEQYQSGADGTNPNNNAYISSNIYMRDLVAFFQSQAPVQLISSQTASNVASISFTSLPTKFKRFQLLIDDMVPISASTPILQVSEDGGSTWKTASTYLVGGFGGDMSTGSNGFPATTTASGIVLAGGNISTSGTNPYQGTIDLSNPANSSGRKEVTVKAMYGDGSSGDGVFYSGGGCWYGDNGAVNAIRVIPTGGNISSGFFRLYGFL